MTKFKIAKHVFTSIRPVFASLVLLSVGTAAEAVTLSVNCGAKEGLTSIGAALKILEEHRADGPNIINVSGSCKEYVLIQNLDRLTLNAVSGASIIDTSGGTREVIDVAHSAGFTLNGFTVTATCPSTCLNGPGYDVISCYEGSDCLLIDNTLSGAGAGAGVGVYPLSKAIVQGGTLKNNYYGLFTNDGGEIFAWGVTVENNVQGVFLNHGGNVVIRVGADNVTPSVIANNTQQGIASNLGGAISVHAPVNIMNNGAEGIALAFGSKLFVGGGIGGSAAISISGNAGSGVSVGDASIAQFGGDAHVTGNAATNIACNSPTALTVGAIAAAGGTAGVPYTNCAN